MKNTLLGVVIGLLFTITSAHLSIAQKADSVNQVNIAQKANIKCMTPPLGFDTLSGLNGYYHRQIGASIVMMKVPGKTTQDAEAAFTDEHIKNIKCELGSKSRMTLNDGNEMLLYRLTYDFRGEKWGRYQTFVSNDDETLWILISFPERYSKDIEGIILKSLRTVKFDER